MVYEERPNDFSPTYEVINCFIETKGEFLVFLRQDNETRSGLWGMTTTTFAPNEDRNKAFTRAVFEETGCELQFNASAYKKTVFIRHPECDFVSHIYHLQLEKKIPVKINPKESKQFFWIKYWKVMKMPLVPDLRTVIGLYPYKQENPVKFCERCGRKPSAQGGRFCHDCLVIVKRDMSKTGYLQKKEYSPVREQKDRKQYRPGR